MATKKVKDAAEAASKLEAFAGKPAEAFEKASAWSRERLEAASKNYAELSSFSKESLEDVVASGKAAATGFRTIGEAVAALVQAATSENVEALKKLLAVKSLSDAVAVQSAYTKTTLDLVLAHSAKINEAAAQTVIETVEPINARLAAVAAKVERLRPAA
jgi:phasin family protein